MRTFFVLLLLPLTFSAYVLAHDAPNVEQVSAHRSRATSFTLTTDIPDVLSAAAAVEEAVVAHHVAEIEAAVAIERQRAIDEEARRRAVAAQSSQSGSSHPGTTVGECTGFAIPAYIIQRESGGNPSAYNPSGAYGCAQTLLSHYSRGQCQGLDPYTIDGQRECVWRLSNGGTNLNPWAATR